MKISKKEMEKFNSEVRETLDMYGILNLNDDYNMFAVSPSLGKVYFHLDDDHSELYSIFIRFEETEKAMKYFNCNPYTGKYNIHTFTYQDAIWQLCRILSFADMDDLPCNTEY